MIYIVVFIVLLVGAIFVDRAPYPRLRKAMLGMEWLLLVCLAGFRYKIGGDTLFYMEMYDDWPSLAQWNWQDVLDGGYQPLWYLLCAICKAISPDFYVLQIALALFVNTAFFRFFVRHTSRPLLAVLLYAVLLYPYYNFEILRASVCVALFLFSFDSLLARRWIPYCLYALVAIGFHLQAILLFLFPLMVFTDRLNVRAYTIIIIIAVVAALAMDVLLYIFSFLPVGGKVYASFFSYLIRGKEPLSVYHIITFLFKFALFVLALYATLRNPQLRLFRFFILWELICTIFAIRYSTFFTRAMDFTHPVIILLLTELLAASNTVENKVYNWLKYGIVAGFFIIYGKIYFQPMNNLPFYRLYIPYSSVFDKHEDGERDWNFYATRHSNDILEDE